MNSTVWVRSGTAGSWTGESEELWRAADITREDTAPDGNPQYTCCTCDASDAATLVVGRDAILQRDVLPLDGTPNLVSLGNLHGPAIIDNLRLRFNNKGGRAKAIYTYCGNICIAVNPYERLHDLYTQEVMARFNGAGTFDDNPPHLYAVAEAAFAHMGRTGQSQSILVSGESGAGKTESVKIMMQYLAERNHQGGVGLDSSSIADAVVLSNPLLETFGNAKTLRNNNSSRFGKFTQILFDTGGNIVGSRVDVYLLEKSRVVHQHEGERSYHVFYQLLGAAREAAARYPEVLHEDLCLPSEAADVNFLAGSGCFDADGIDDGEWFAEMVGIMTAIQINTNQQQNMFRVIAAVLHLGQIRFDSALNTSGDDKAQVIGGEDSDGLCCASTLLSCSPADLHAAVVTRHISARTETYTINLTQTEAEHARDALAKALYAKLFEWLVERINVSTAAAPESTVRSTVGVLDIFGFESFASNSLEQLLINFANEKLQQQFTWYVFKLEQEEYDKEGIVWNSVSFKDNQPILDAIEGRISALSLLDEECRLQRGTDTTFVDKLKDHAKRLPRFSPELGGESVAVLTFPKTSRDAPEFSIRHYAGVVVYDATNFRDKNKDTLHADLLELVQRGSSDTFVNRLFGAFASPRERSRGASKNNTLGSQFRSQLTSLVEKINHTTVHYVRCIKPNCEKSPDLFSVPGVATQLRCQGILEAIRISREAYPNRTLHADVVRRYSICFGKSMQATGSAQETATHMVQTLLSESQYQVGKTKVFFKRDGLEAMETRRTQVLHQLCVHIQSSTRRFLAMKYWKNTKAASAFIQRITRGMLARMRAKQESAAVVLQAVLRCNSQRCQHRVICSGALALQCLYRAILARAALSTRKLGLAAMRIQSRVRGRSACRHYRMLLLAVVILQAYGRRHIHVRRYVEIRDTAREDAMLCNQVNKLSRLLAEEREKRLALEAQNADLVSQTGVSRGDLASAATATSSAMTSSGVASAAVTSSAASAAVASFVETSAAEASSATMSAAPQTMPSTNSPAAVRRSLQPRTAEPAAGNAADGLRQFKYGSPIGVRASPRPEPEAGLWGKIGGLLGGTSKSSSSQPPPTPARSPVSVSYDDEVVEALEKERALLKRKLAQETKHAQRNLEEKDRKIRELQKRDLRATRKSAQEIGMLQEERRLRKEVEGKLEQEQYVVATLRQQMEIMQEESVQLKAIVRRTAADNAALESKIHALQQHVGMLSSHQRVDAADEMFHHSSDLSAEPDTVETARTTSSSSAMFNRASRLLKFT